LKADLYSLWQHFEIVSVTGSSFYLRAKSKVCVFEMDFENLVKMQNAITFNRESTFETTKTQELCHLQNKIKGFHNTL